MIRNPKAMMKNLSYIKILHTKKKKNRHVTKVCGYLESSECGKKEEESDNKEMVID